MDRFLHFNFIQNLEFLQRFPVRVLSYPLSNGIINWMCEKKPRTLSARFLSQSQIRGAYFRCFHLSKKIAIVSFRKYPLLFLFSQRMNLLSQLNKARVLHPFYFWVCSKFAAKILKIIYDARGCNDIFNIKISTIFSRSASEIYC